MQLVELLVVLLLACVFLAWLARRAGVPYPIALVLGGAVLGFVPALPRVQLDPNLVLVIVLPPILYQAALFTSWRDFKANARAISLLAVGLVVATTVAIAVTARWLLPELPWAAAFALGAIVSPPDAVAATAVLGHMQIPRRIVTILEGESLVNDASGLVLYKFAVAAIMAGAFSLLEASAQFVLVAAAGVAIGMALGWLFVAIHRRINDSLIEIMLSVALPYSAYLAAELVHVSGVLAVVAAGLVRGRHAPEAFSPQTRILAHAVWNVIVFLINCLVFIVIGLQLPVAVAGLADDHTLLELCGYAIGFTLVAMLVRMAWVFPGTYALRWLNRKFGRFEAYPPWQQVTVVGWCGMRGIVSLAAALALPASMPNGAAFPGRDLIVFLTFVIILLTLVIPGITLAPLIRRLKVGGDWDAHEELRVARDSTAHAALREIHRLEQHGDITDTAAAHLRQDYESRLARTLPHGLLYAPGADPLIRGRRAALVAERRELIRLWREDKIGDEVLHEIERELDFEASRLGH